MWLLGNFHIVSGLALKTYFRMSVGGSSVPQVGPVLLVANHPNSLLDPAAVSFAAARPVRFLAKSTLFTHPTVGWIVRASGAVPVYRRVDDPEMVGRNSEMFDAVFRALADGDAIGLFPEGVSHDLPSLAPLKTGAARIALGAAARIGAGFPVIPLGLVFREKTRFRSRAHVLVGAPVEWNYLVSQSGEPGPDAVRELTARIDLALREVTINLASWEDREIVELADLVYAAEYRLSGELDEHVRRVREITTSLDALRRSGADRWVHVAEALRRHRRMLRWFGLTPNDLVTLPRASTALRWSLRRLPLLVVALSGLWLVGSVLFWVPYRITGLLGSRAGRKGSDLVSTMQLLGGTAVFSGWILLLSLAALLLKGAWAGIAALLVLPPLALLSVIVRERLSEAVGEATRFFRTARRSDGILSELRHRQTELAKSLDMLWRTARGASPGASAP